MLLKVCGMRDAKNIAEVASLKPDMMGFIFHPKSPRHVGEEFDEKILDHLPASVRKVAVMVDPSVEQATRIMEKYEFDFIQLHGDEPQEVVHELSEKGFGIIKVVAGNRRFDDDYMRSVEPLIDYWLIDTRTAVHGGTGITFDRKNLEGYAFVKPVLLSGGLDAEEVQKIRDENIPKVVGVDVNSKMEDAPGVKNVEKIKFVMECLK